MNPGLLRETVNDALPLFAADLLHLLGPNGLPVMGRSVCYRMAVPAPLIFASISMRIPCRPPRRGERWM